MKPEYDKIQLLLFDISSENKSHYVTSMKLISNAMAEIPVNIIIVHNISHEHGLLACLCVFDQRTDILVS